MTETPIDSSSSNTVQATEDLKPKLRVKRKMVTATPKGISTPMERPVVIKRGPRTPAVTIAKKGATPLKTTRAQSDTSHSKAKRKVTRPPSPRLGKPDFSRAIVEPNSYSSKRKKAHASLRQILFFDTAVAVLAVSFMILVFTNL